MTVKLVTQETLTDCGLACVAMVSGQSLATVRKVAIKELGYPKDGPYTTTCRVPDDWLLKNKRPLLHGREVLQAVLATWQSRAKELPC